MVDLNRLTVQFIGHISNEILSLLPYHETSEVILTGERLRKNQRHHPELEDKLYQLLPVIIQDPHYVCLDKVDEQTVIFYYHNVGNHYLRVAILLKSPQEPAHYKNSIQSFRYARKRELQADIKDGRLI